MEIGLLIVALVAGVVGLLGVVVPVLPGTLLSFGGLVCAYFVTGSTITTTQLVVCGIVSVIVILLDYLLPGYFTKVFGGTKSGITGATIGTFVGFLFGIPGIIFGPFFGAVIGEMVGGKTDIDRALSVGLGSLLSFLIGSGIKLIAGLYMIYHIIKVFIAAVA
ncbi:MAG: DUF456 domain-containing protein [Alistipes sp.]|nr:DUF456 domain-containing protein [Alistipes sp.]